LGVEIKPKFLKGLHMGFGVPANAECFLAYEVTRSSLGWMVISVLVVKDLVELKQNGKFPNGGIALLY
jgi:hypothetical protein